MAFLIGIAVSCAVKPEKSCVECCCRQRVHDYFCRCSECRPFDWVSRAEARVREDMAYLRGRHFAEPKVYCKTIEEQEFIEKFKTALKPLEELKKDLRL